MVDECCIYHNKFVKLYMSLEIYKFPLQMCFQGICQSFLIYDFWD